MNKSVIKIFLFVLICCVQKITANWILSVIQGNQIVNSNNSLSISIKASTNITANNLKLSFNQYFGILPNSCLVNSTLVNCSISTNSTTLQKQIIFSSSSFIANTQYLLSVSVTNPYYSQNFELKASNNNVLFLTSGIIQILAKIITCTLKGESDIVGQKTVGIFNILNDPILLVNSQISIKTATQTVFKNIFNPTPNCVIQQNNMTLGCSLSTIFGEQIVQVTSLPIISTSNSLTVLINSINNPPFNNTFGDFQLQIQDDQGRSMQQCKFTQQSPNKLQKVKNIVISGWNNKTGQSSPTVSWYLNTFFTNLIGQSILITYPPVLTLNPSAPSSFYYGTSTNNTNKLYITNMTLTPSSILFYSAILNPSYIIPLSISIYVIFNQTNFRQQYTFTNGQFNLDSEKTDISISLLDNRTLVSTKGTLTFKSSNVVDKTQSGGVNIRLQQTVGMFVCENISNIVSNANNNFNTGTLSVTSCTFNTLNLFVDDQLLIKTYSLTYRVLNHFSTQSNSISLTLSTKISNYLISAGTVTSNNYSIGSTSLSYIANTIPLTITNLSPQLNALSSIDIKQPAFYSQLNYSSYMGNRVRRVIQLTPPSNLILDTTKSISILNLNQSVCTIVSVSQLSLAKIQIVIEGYLSIRITNITNPNNYILGQRSWVVNVTDINSNPSANGTVLMNPQYTQVAAKVEYSLSNQTIQQTSNMSINIQPQLFYTNSINQNQTPEVIITLSDSQITKLINCTGCVLISSKKISLPYYSVLMGLIFQIKNSRFPKGIAQNLSLEIKYNSFVYETYSTNYVLEPFLMGYLVTFTGLYGEIGFLNVTLVQTPKENYTLIYSGQNGIFQNPICENCTSTQLVFRGKIIYFQKASIYLQAKNLINGTQIIFAQANAEVLYSCFSIPGCRICSNQSIDGGLTNSLVCQKCFDKTLNSLYLLYDKKCVQSCPVQTYSNNVTCQKCGSQCYNCTNSTVCLQCVPGYLVMSFGCTNQCPSDYIKNSTHCWPKPIVCPSSCLFCSKDNICTICVFGYKFLNDYCYAQCPYGYITSKIDNSKCQIFIPPQQAKYFPFAFLIISLVFFIILVIIKLFQKRSLMMGNFISVLSIFQFGSFLMTLIYTFIQVQANLFVQALIFILLLAKILINVIFLIYFLKSIRDQQQFQSWLNKQQQNKTLYKIILVFSLTISFQTFRCIYSRFMGLKIFFGKFSSGLIFKPINYFSLSYSILFSIPLLILCFYNINLQNGYKTSIFYSCIETIILQLILTVCWIVDWKRGNNDQFFDYQVYKISNEFQDSIINAINVKEQNQFGGSTQEILRSYRKIQQTREKIPEWKMKSLQPYIEEPVSIEPQQQEEIKSQHQQIRKKKSLFKIKIIEQWRKMAKQLPSSSQKFRLLKKSRSNISKSPYSKRYSNIKSFVNRSDNLKKYSSVQKIQIRFPQSVHMSAGDKVRKYFYNFYQDQSEKNQKEISKSMISSVKGYEEKVINQNKQIRKQDIKKQINEKKANQTKLKYSNQPQKIQEQHQSIQQNFQKNIQKNKKIQIYPVTIEQQRGSLEIQQNRKGLQIQQQSYYTKTNQISTNNNYNLQQILERLNFSKKEQKYSQNKADQQLKLQEEEQELPQQQGFFQLSNQGEQQLNYKLKHQKTKKYTPQSQLEQNVFDQQQLIYQQESSTRKLKKSHVQSSMNVSNKIVNKSSDNAKNARQNKFIKSTNNILKYNQKQSQIEKHSSRSKQYENALQIQFKRPDTSILIPSSAKHKGSAPKQQQNVKQKVKSNSKRYNQSMNKSLNIYKDDSRNSQYYEQQDEQSHKKDYSDKNNNSNSVNQRKKKRKPRRKLSKAEKQTQKLYLQRLNNVAQERKSLSKKKKLKELSDF